ncbi:MAG: molybdopterin-dependent oxidoreductase [Chloroflexi bacterium]|nr:molybdopterin-dependent oxidoreductase [Chloroflexota bacterium]
MMSEEKIVKTVCSHDCGGRCQLKVHVRDGKIIRIETDSSDEPQLRACLRGRASRQLIYAPDRLKYPMKRVGERGEGKFERISWDEALDTVARELIRVKDAYGNASILLLGGKGTGNQGALHQRAAELMLDRFGGYTQPWGDAGFEGVLFGTLATWGTLTTGNAREDLLNSKLIIMWCWNPAVTIWDAGTNLILSRARDRGIKIVSVDPRLTESTAAVASQWVPIRPTTDSAMLIAMAYVIISRGLQDQAFLDKYVIGFDRYRDYVLGKEDGQARTPEWAAPITGVPAATIEQLAIEYATAKPAALIPGWVLGRGALGEQAVRASDALAIITGNVGKEGGYAGGFQRYHSLDMHRPRGARNPVEENTPPRPNSLYKLRGTNPTNARIHSTKIYDAILKGKAGGYPCDPKMAYIESGNYLNSHPNTPKGVAAFKKLEFIVIHEQRMTSTARFADILLPVSSFLEREDVMSPWLGAPYYVYMNKVVETLYDCWSDREICAELSRRLGIDDYYGGKTDEEWLREIVKKSGQIPDFDKLREQGVVKLRPAKPFVAFREQVEDPVKHPFPTLSGKIELYSQHLAEMNNPRLPPIPKYIPGVEGPEDPIAKKYPLQLTSNHPKTSVHGMQERTGWLDEVEPRRVWINTEDARRRGIADGDDVLIFNDRGKVRIKARVTERIMPGVLNIGEGGWFDFDADGVDRGGCANVLIIDEHTPGGGWSAFAPLVEAKKA